MTCIKMCCNINIEIYFILNVVTLLSVVLDYVTNLFNCRISPRVLVML